VTCRSHFLARSKCCLCRRRRPRHTHQLEAAASRKWVRELLFSSAKDFEEHDHFEDTCCVLLDINLKDGSGIELRYGLTAAGRAVPVIFMTGNDNPTVRDAALESGCLAYLTKPFSAKSLIEPIERACARR
jgi:FixJ family two-component response regulator